MINLASQPAEIRFTLEITRAATGLKETVEMVGHVVPPPAEIPSQPLVSEGEQK
jgi:hypothetical protein